MFEQTSAVKLQSWFRGSLYRLKHLPIILYRIQKYLKTRGFWFSQQNVDGRINSCQDEKLIKY